MVKEKGIVIFDGICVLCNRAIDFLIRHDEQQGLCFLPAQSPAAQKVIKRYAINLSAFSSIVYIENNKTYFKSTAVLRVFKRLPLPWALVYGAIVIPNFIRHFIYDMIARHRYQWFGKRQQCRVMPPERRYPRHTD